jgi:hypothetical protein
MIVIDNLLKDFKDLKEDVNINHNYCLELFNNLVDESTIDIDVFYSARALTSIINSIVNKKVEYVNYIIDSQIEMLSFLNSYDDKYLSNTQNLFSNESSTEITTVIGLIEDNFDLTQFLEDFLTRANKLKKNSLSGQLKRQLDEMLKEFEEKYKGGNNYEE